jgi:hypothetical protein
MEIKIPVFTAIRYMVFELGRPLRGFATKAEAEAFVRDDSDLRIHYIPAKYKTIKVEEAPF